MSILTNSSVLGKGRFSSSRTFSADPFFFLAHSSAVVMIVFSKREYWDTDNTSRLMSFEPAKKNRCSTFQVLICFPLRMSKINHIVISPFVCLTIAKFPSTIKGFFATLPSKLVLLRTVFSTGISDSLSNVIGLYSAIFFVCGSK